MRPDQRCLPSVPAFMPAPCRRRHDGCTHSRAPPRRRPHGQPPTPLPATGNPGAAGLLHRSRRRSRTGAATQRLGRRSRRGRSDRHSPPRRARSAREGHRVDRAVEPVPSPAAGPPASRYMSSTASIRAVASATAARLPGVSLRWRWSRASASCCRSWRGPGPGRFRECKTVVITTTPDERRRPGAADRSAGPGPRASQRRRRDRAASRFSNSIATEIRIPNFGSTL
jgi:hypothetical protein